jgi:1-deoxy-D-xylulose-5-phosphate synthase
LGLKAAEHDEVGTYHMADKNSIESFGACAAKYLNDIVKSDNKIHVINAAMTLGTGFESFAQTNKENYHDVGIAEEHAVSLASGMVLGGLKPIVNLYSTFMQRSYDQIQHDLARLHLPVLFLVDRADLSPGDGSTHHGIYDVSFLKTIPNVTITAPRDLKQLTDLIELGLSNKTDPFFIRYPKLPLLNPLYKQSTAVQIGI